MSFWFQGNIFEQFIAHIQVNIQIHSSALFNYIKNTENKNKHSLIYNITNIMREHLMQLLSTT
jgi:hypothetical protein